MTNEPEFKTASVKAKKISKTVSETLTEHGYDVDPIAPLILAYGELSADLERISHYLRKDALIKEDGSVNELVNKKRQTTEGLLKLAKNLKLLPSEENQIETEDEDDDF